MKFIRAMLVLSLFVSLNTLAAPVGVFSEVDGKVTVMRGEVIYEGAKGVEVAEQDIIETGDDASVQLDMNDGSILKIAGGTKVMLSDYKLDDQGNVVDAAVDVLSGWLRFAVSRLKGNSARYRFNTAVMTVGIRGTEGVIEAGSEAGALQLVEGQVSVSRFDETGQAASQVVGAGQFISRTQGQGFQRTSRVPARFGARRPFRMQARMQRRAQRLANRGLTPRQIRRVTGRDVQRYLNNHPRMKQRLWRGFKKRWQNDPQFRNMVKKRANKQQLRNNPKARKAVRKEIIRREKVKRRLQR